MRSPLKISIILCFLLGLFVSADAQLKYFRYDSIPLIKSSDTLELGWVGGLNNPQISEIDLNFDGLNDLFIYEKDGSTFKTFVNEGVAGLFKGLGPNLMGVFPSRAIYFWAYSTAKRNVNGALPKANRDTPFVHVTSAAMAGNSCRY